MGAIIILTALAPLILAKPWATALCCCAKGTGSGALPTTPPKTSKSVSSAVATTPGGLVPISSKKTEKTG